MYVYRILRADEYAAFKEGKNILAKCPGGNFTMEQHVSRKSNKTPWISTSKELYLLLDWLIHKSPNAAVIRIDLSNVEYRDISTQAKCFENGVKCRWARNWAVGRQEVLIKDCIPADACELVMEPMATMKAFSRKESPEWQDLYGKFFEKPTPKKHAIPALVKKIQKQTRPNLSVYRIKRILELVKVLEGLTENINLNWYSAAW